MEQTMKVQGQGILKVKPDTMRLTMQLNGIEKVYEEAVAKANQVNEVLKACLMTVKLDVAALKTTDFNIEPSYKGYNDEHGVWQNELVGYQYNHQLKLEMPIDQQRLGKLFNEIAKSEITPTIQIAYTVKDVAATKNALLGVAVQDAKQKATILATAADVTLGEIVTIDYHYASNDIQAPMGQPLLAKASRVNFDMNPDDIELKDQVTITWKIHA